MPIYIDSRREGTKFRYLRRSCRPNVTLKTYTTREGQCNYCFVALHDLSAGTELTAQWYMQPMNQEGKFDNVEWWASRLLANFGDCACDKTEPCRLATLDRRRSPKSLELNTKSQSRIKKAKNKQAISPLSTGQATNSRAGSENNRLQDDDEQADSRSVSGSSRSKSQSRDITPTNIGILDADPVLGSEMTAREKKKIAMAEKTFQKLEQGVTFKRRRSEPAVDQLSVHLPSAPHTTLDKYLCPSPVRLVSVADRLPLTQTQAPRIVTRGHHHLSNPQTRTAVQTSHHERHQRPIPLHPCRRFLGQATLIIQCRQSRTRQNRVICHRRRGGSSQRQINVCSSGCLKIERDLTSCAPKIVPISLTRRHPPSYQALPRAKVQKMWR